MPGTDTRDLDDFLHGILADCEATQNECLKAIGQVARDAVIRNLNRSNMTDLEQIHLKDDVQLSLNEDKTNGGKTARIRGGKKTGTLWHIVNDGTYRSRGNHFIDKAMTEVDGKAESIIDAVMASKFGG